MQRECGRVIITVLAALALGGAGAVSPEAAPAAPNAARQAAEATSLLDLFAEARTGNSGLKAAEAGLKAADHNVYDSWFGYLPRASMTLNPQREFQQVYSTQNPVYQTGTRYFGNAGYSFQILQPVVDMAAAARIAGAQAEQRNQRSQVTAAQQKLTYDLIEAYLLTLASLDSERLAAAEEQAYDGHREVIRRRMARGLANRTELAEIEARIEKAQSDRILAHGGIGKALSILRRLTGRTVTALLPMKQDIPMGHPVPPDPEAWVISANDTNPELKAMAAQVDVAAAEFKRMVGDALPRLDIVLSDQHLDVGGSLYGGGARTDQQIAELRLTVPLFNGDGRGYPAFAGYQRQQQARYAADDRQMEIDQRVRAAYEDAAQDSDAAHSLQMAAKNHGIVRDDVRRRFVAGVAALGDVIDAERDYVRAQREMLASHYNYLISMVQLKRLTGTIGDDDARYIDDLLDREHAYVAMASAATR